MKEKKPSSLARILSYAGGHKNLTILGCILSALSAVLGLAPYLCVWLVARSVLSTWPGLDGAGNLGLWGWMAVWFAIGSILLYFAALMSTHIAAFRTAWNIRRAAMTHVLKLPLGFFTGNQSGRLRKLIDDNAGLTEDLLAHKLPDLAATAVTPIAAIVVLFLFDWRMGLLCLLTMALALLSMCLMMGGKNAGFFHRYQKEIERMSGEAVEYVRGIPVVKMFQQTVYSFKAFYAAIQDYSNLASQYAMSCRTGQTCFLTFINGAFALLIPAALLIASGGDVRTALVNLIFYALFAPACGQMINRIMYMSEAVMEADEAIGRLDEILSQQPMEEPKVQKRPVNAAVSFDHVTFTYPGADRPALKDVSFDLQPGQVVALVGPSGGGKTTAASLIPRFWDVDSGSVTVGGADVRELDSAALMGQVAFVFQDTRLFKESLLENIRAARTDASREEVLAAAHAAQCDDILEKLPQGLDTVVGAKGVYLSGGEQQRIALARAILKDAPIVVLDEATAFADPENEHQIQKAFETLTRNKTVLMIAHRLSTVQNADNIIVLNEGKIAEQGSHNALLEKNGVYREGAGVLEDVSFTARQEEVTALIGPSGGGKSTACKLAARFWDVTGGKVLLGGTDVSTVDPETLLRSYSMVFQDVVLFRDTVMENIRLGRRGATDEEVLEAAKAAQCDEFIRKLPQGYQTVIGENGSTLSGGERQRISIARALLKDAPVVLLDEATASLDVENESAVQTALSRLLQGKTVLVIAHRMRTVAGADHIVVLEDGHVAQQGAPAELLEQGGLYRRMVELQNESAQWRLG